MERIRSLDFTLEDELGVVFVADLIATPSGYALADTGGWVLLLDRHLALKHRFGGVGSGPRELRLPQDLENLPDGQLAIFDSGNNRLTVIDNRGKLVATVPAGDGPLTDFAALNGSTFLVGSAGDRSLVRRVPAGGPLFGQIPERAWTAIDAGASVPALGTHLVADAGGRIHHFDEHSNAILSYSPTGSLERLVTLPPQVHESIREQAARMENSFGGRAVLSQTWMLGIGSHEGRVVLSGTPPGVDGVGLVLDPRGTEATPVVAAPSLPASEFHHVVRIVLEEDRITTVRREGLYQYRIEWPDRLKPGT
ncbi:MAG: hypothetical protein HKN73_05035 [Gemmatimonadetes bacterium]|nr:hypothetical protein [Gemmatimonadota bacterium]